MYFPDAVSSVQYGRRLNTGSKFAGFSPRVFMRRACSACALVGAALAVVLPVEFCVIQWGITAQRFVSGFCALCVCRVGNHSPAICQWLLRPLCLYLNIC